MLRSVQSLILAAMIAATGVANAGIIQPVGYNCGEGCNTCDYGGCNQNSCQSGCDQCDACDGGRQRCGLKSTWHDFGMNWTGRCGPIGRAARWRVPGAKCLKWCMDTKGSGDSGWAPPARMPVNRTHTGFASYASNGSAYGGAPMVYQPTDTAQLGYRYAHVPTWRSNPQMIPATPVPSNFHTRYCPPNLGGRSCMGGGCMTMHGGMMGSDCMMMDGGMIMEGEVMGGNYCPSCVATPAPRSSTEAVVHLSQARKPNSTVAVTATPVRATTRDLEKKIRLTAQATKPAPTPEVQVSQTQVVRPQVKLPTPPVQVAQPQMRMQLPQLPPQQWQQPQVQMPQPQQNMNRQPQQNSTQRRTSQRRTPQKKSGGWFGLPSLSDVKF